MQVEINEDMKFAFAEKITETNINDIAKTIKDYSKCELEISVYENEIDIDNKTFNKIETAITGDWIVINNIGYFIYPTKEEMELF